MRLCMCSSMFFVAAVRSTDDRPFVRSTVDGSFVRSTTDRSFVRPTIAPSLTRRPLIVRSWRPCAAFVDRLPCSPLDCRSSVRWVVCWRPWGFVVRPPPPFVVARSAAPSIVRQTCLRSRARLPIVRSWRPCSAFVDRLPRRSLDRRSFIRSVVCWRPWAFAVYPPPPSVVRRSSLRPPIVRSWLPCAAFVDRPPYRPLDRPPLARSIAPSLANRRYCCTWYVIGILI